MHIAGCNVCVLLLNVYNARSATRSVVCVAALPLYHEQFVDFCMQYVIDRRSDVCDS